MNRAAGVLLIDGRGWILLQLRDGNGAYPFHWATVGGGALDGEEDEAAARRELWEETGYVVGPLRFGHRVTLALPNGTLRVAALYYAAYDDAQPLECRERLRIEFVNPAVLDSLLIYPRQDELIRVTLRRIMVTGV